MKTKMTLIMLVFTTTLCAATVSSAHLTDHSKSMSERIVTLDPSTQTAPLHNSGDTIMFTINGIIISYIGSVNTTIAPADFRVYANQTLSLSCKSKINKLKITGKTARDGFLLASDQGQIVTGADIPKSTEKTDMNDPLIVIDKINSKYLNLTCSKQLRAYMIEVSIDSLEGDYEEFKDTIPHNQIWYTSNGSRITPYSTSAFGASIISNTCVRGVGKIIFSSSVTEVGYESFLGCTNLTSISLPNSVKSIGRRAFANCSDLESITIGNSVQEVGYEAFLGCTNLTSISLPNSVKSIGSLAFAYCSNMESIIIGNSVQKIEYKAFHECSNLKSVSINSQAIVNTGSLKYYFEEYYHSYDYLSSIISDALTF